MQSLDFIKDAVCSAFDITSEQMLSKCRQDYLAIARMCFCYNAKHCGWPMRTVAEYLNKSPRRCYQAFDRWKEIQDHHGCMVDMQDQVIMILGK